MEQTENAVKNVIDYSPLIGALIAGFFAVFGIIVANWLNSRSQKAMHDLAIEKEKRATRLVKAEELYLCMVRWRKETLSAYMAFFQYLSGKIDFDTAQDLAFREKSTAKSDSEILDMLINIYFPELKDDYDLFFKSRDDMSKYIRRGAREKYTVEEFLVDQSVFQKITNDMIIKLSDIVRSS